ncbi:hypothetical protein EYC84_002328 [Monilinia fructicola]|uniref:MARVEL domain-containing protein n=1 Tax=Monilinia fructicola TaxID=38448 RepID=A0A5M9JMV0_MONFR|nr:hypothetical protein EYC84_002328 [Monilinia fructicola]
MVFGMFFAFWRFAEIITLIPILGMLAFFVNIYASNNALTPNYILVLFIVSVLACAWAIATLFTYHRTRNNALFVSFIDLCFVGALIAGVYSLRYITNANCASFSTGSWYYINFGSWGNANVNGVSVRVDKTCSMLKACFALGIMNIIFFFITNMVIDEAGVTEATGARIGGHSFRKPEALIDAKNAQFVTTDSQ